MELTKLEADPATSAKAIADAEAALKVLQYQKALVAPQLADAQQELADTRAAAADLR